MSYYRMSVGISYALIEAIYSSCHYQLPKQAQHPAFTMRTLQHMEWCVSWWYQSLCIGGAFGKYAEMHLAIKPEFRGHWLTRGRFTEFFDWYFTRRTVMIVDDALPHARRLLLFAGSVEEFNRLTLTREAYQVRASFGFHRCP